MLLLPILLILSDLGAITLPRDVVKWEKNIGYFIHLPDTTMGPFDALDLMMDAASEYGPLIPGVIRPWGYAFAAADTGQGAYWVVGPRGYRGPFGAVLSVDLSPRGDVGFTWIPLPVMKRFENFSVRGDVVYRPWKDVGRSVRVQIEDRVFGPFDDAFGPWFSPDGNHVAFRYRLGRQEFVRVDGDTFGPFFPLPLFQRKPHRSANLYVSGQRINLDSTYLGLIVAHDQWHFMAEPWLWDALLDEAIPVAWSPDGAFAFAFRKSPHARRDTISPGSLTPGPYCISDVWIMTPRDTLGPLYVAYPLWAGGDLLVVEEGCPHLCCYPAQYMHFVLRWEDIPIRWLNDFLPEVDPALLAVDRARKERVEGATPAPGGFRVPGGVVIGGMFLPYDHLQLMGDSVRAFSGDREVARFSLRNLLRRDLRWFPDFRLMRLEERGAVIRVVARPENLEIPDPLGFRLLHWAVWDGDSGLVRMLLQEGASLLSTVEQPESPPVAPDVCTDFGMDCRGRGPGLVVAQEKDDDLARPVPIPRPKSFQGFSVFNLAAYRGHKALLRMLIREAIQQGHMNFVAFDGKNLVHFAAFAGDTVAIRLLVGMGVNPVAQDRYGNTPLHLAVMGGEKEALQVFRDLGARVSRASLCRKARTRAMRRFLGCGN